MMFNVPSKIEEFELEVSGKELASILSRVDKVIQYSDAEKLWKDTQMIVCDGTSAFVVGRTSDTVCCHYLCDTMAMSALEIDFNQLKKVVDKKDKISFAFDRKEVTIKAGRSKTTLVCRQSSFDTLETVNKEIGRRSTVGGATFEIKKSDLEKCYVAASMLGIKDVFSNQRSFVCVTANDGVATLVSHTSWSASSTSFESDCNYRFAAYTDMIQIIRDLSEDNTGIYVDIEGFIVARSNNFIAAFPPAPAQDRDYGMYENFVSGLGKHAARFQMQGTELKNIVSEIESLFIKKDDNPNGIIKIGDGKVRVSYSCDNGSKVTNATAKTENSAEFKCDLRLLSTVLKAMKKLELVTLFVYGLKGQYKCVKYKTKSDDMEVNFVLYIPQ